MGVITYLFHRSERITPQRFHMFFLDVGENIHFHYRDLRIELSTGEFEELAAGFMKYAPAVLDMIREGYRDGVLPNTNAHDTIKTFWDKSKLAHPVKYNDRRLSIEENVDGYHIHFRNYKLLLDRESFAEFAHGMGLAMLQLENKLPVDPVRMLEINDLAPSLLSRGRQDGREDIAILVEPAFRDKAEQVLTGLGYTRQGAKEDGRFARGEQRVRLLKTAPAEAGATHAAGLVGLPTFIDKHAARLSAEDLNQLKLRLLYLFKRAEGGHIPAFALEDVVVDAATNTPSVDLFRRASPVEPTAEFSRLSGLLTRRKLFFVKPPKALFDQAQRDALQAALQRHILDKVASHPCVNRVYQLGSSTRDRSGVYKVPFVHFDWVKLASDFDLLIELEPDHENDLPEEWEKKFPWAHNSCIYAHLGDLGHGMESDYARSYPGVRFFEHMLETYLFFPSTGDRAVKDEFLGKIAASVLFERPGIVDWFEAHYPHRITHIRRVEAASFNKVYDIACPSGRYALKIYVTRYSQDPGGHKLAYELSLAGQLAGFGLDLPAPLPNSEGTYVSDHAEGRAVLFQYVDGKYLHEPNEQDAFLAGQLLARIHLYSDQIDLPQELSPPRVADTLVYWLNAYRDYARKGQLPAAPDLDAHIAAVRTANHRTVHCHGDVSPRNYVYRDDRCWLIDFQNAGLGPAVLDLADGMAEFAARRQRFNANVMTAFLTGYQSLRPLDADEKADLDRLLPAQFLAKQARVGRASEHGYAWNAELIASLQQGLAAMRQTPQPQGQITAGP